MDSGRRAPILLIGLTALPLSICRTGTGVKGDYSVLPTRPASRYPNNSVHYSSLSCLGNW